MNKTADSKIVNRPFLTGDDAKQFIRDDEFGLERMVDAFATTLTHRVTADGYVIGIEGPWGSGKSTFANFVTERIEDTAAQHQIIKFEPWLIGGRDTLLFFYFGQLASKIDEANSALGLSRELKSRWKKTKKKLAKKVRKYGKYAGALATPVAAAAAYDPTGTTTFADMGLKFVSGLARMLGFASPTLEELKSEIEKGLRDLAKISPEMRFSVFIDDSDRLEPNEALEVLRLVCKVADFPLVSYVLCFDKNILTKQIDIAHGVDNGADYLDKIFQNIVTMPPQEPFALRRFLRRLLTKSFPNEMGQVMPHDPDFGSRRHYLLEVWAGKFLETPRDVILLHEAIKLGWPHIASRADFFDYVWLQLTKLKAPDIYDWTQRYVCEVGAYRDGGRPSDQEPLREAINLEKIMAERGWGEKSYSSGIGYFLPGVDPFVLGDEKKRVFDFRDQELAKFERGCRLGSPSHWRQYFAFDNPTYAVEDGKIREFRRATLGDVPRAAEILLSLAKMPHDIPGYFADVLLDRLSDEPADSYSPQEISGLAKTFAEVMDEIAILSESKSSGRYEVWRKASGLLRKPGSDDFKELFETGQSVNWLAHLVRGQGFAQERNKGDQPSSMSFLLSEAEHKQAIEIIIRRFKELGAEEIFRRPQPLDILFCWLQLGDKDDVRMFIKDAVQSDEMFLSALNAMRIWVSSSERGVYYPLRREYLGQFMDADAAKERLEKLAAAGASDGSLASLAKELLKEWDDEKF